MPSVSQTVLCLGLLQALESVPGGRALENGLGRTPIMGECCLSVL